MGARRRLPLDAAVWAQRRPSPGGKEMAGRASGAAPAWALRVAASVGDRVRAGCDPGRGAERRPLLEGGGAEVDRRPWRRRITAAEGGAGARSGLTEHGEAKAPGSAVGDWSPAPTGGLDHAPSGSAKGEGVRSGGGAGAEPRPACPEGDGARSVSDSERQTEPEYAVRPGLSSPEAAEAPGAAAPTRSEEETPWSSGGGAVCAGGLVSTAGGGGQAAGKSASTAQKQQPCVGAGHTMLPPARHCRIQRRGPSILA